MRIKTPLTVWLKTALFGSILATVLSLPIIFIKMSYYVMPTIGMITPFMIITTLVSLVVSIPTLAFIIIFRESLLRKKIKSSIISKKISFTHWIGGVITFLLIAFAFEFSSLSLIFLSVFLVSFLTFGHFLWQRELKKFNE